MSLTEITTQCVYTGCGRPLGQDSKDLGYNLCHEHRKCIICEQDISPAEAIACYKASVDNKEDIEVIHARCYTLRIRSNGSEPTITIKQSEYDFLNLCRLCIIPNADLNIISNQKVAWTHNLQLIQNMDFDILQKHIKMMEACAANAGAILSKDPKEREKRNAILNLERKELAKAEASTSSRPANKKPVDLEEVQLSHFMEIHEIRERTVGLKLMRDLNKAVKGFMAMGMAEPTAREYALKAMQVNRQITK